MELDEREEVARSGRRDESEHKRVGENDMCKAFQELCFYPSSNGISMFAYGLRSSRPKTDEQESPMVWYESHRPILAHGAAS